jgi:hypothetical protein
MIRNLREYIPKATGNFFIKSLKTNMNFYLLQYISKTPEMCDDLEEDPDVAQKRTYYIEAQKKLKKITKAVGLDEQLSKYFKEDNTKIIENILQQQGINAQNAKDTEQEKEKKPQKSGISINDIGIPPKKEKNISQATKKNLFGTGSSKANNLFGNPLESKPETTTPNQKKTQTNLFGTSTNTNTNANANNNTNANNQKTTSKAGNLFGNIGSSISKGASNLFGSNTNANKNTPKVNQPNQKSAKDLNLKLDSKDVNNKGNNKGNVEPKEAMNFFNKNKQNNASGTNPAQKGGNPGGNTNTTGKKPNANALANLFGKK